MSNSTIRRAEPTFEDEVIIIETSLIESGASLERVRDKEKWRGKVYGGETMTSFKHFCKSIKISYQTAWERIEAGKIARLNPEVKTVKEALAVRRLAMPQRNAGASGESGSAGGVDAGFSNQSAGNEGLGRTNGQKLPNDATGIPIPPDIQPFWNRNEEVQFLLGMVSKLRVTLEKADESRDKLFCKIDRQGCISRLKQIYEEIESAKSYAVCPDCNGIFTQDCPMCSGRGTLSKFYWGLVPEEIQRMRKTQD